MNRYNLQGWDTWNYPIDFVFCIDVTGSMHDCIENVKKMAVNFKNDFLAAMHEAGKGCTGAMRTKVIAFSDERIGEKMQVSPFYTMPNQEDEFRNFLNNLTSGGHSESRSAYEALIEAFKSDWVKEGAKRRWITVLFTDAPAYTEKIEELVDTWNGLESNFKRLVIFAPDHPSWENFMSQATNSMHYLSSQAGAEVSYEELKCALFPPLPTL